MRIVRFEHEGRSGYGILEGEKISVLWGTPYDGGLENTTGEVMSLPEVTLLAPCEPDEDRGPGVELPGPRRRDRPPPARGALALYETLHRGDRPG